LKTDCWGFPVKENKIYRLFLEGTKIVHLKNNEIFTTYI